MARVPDYMQNYIQEDVEDVINRLDVDHQISAESKNTSIDVRRTEDGEICYDVSTTFQTDSKSVEVCWTYFEEVGSDDVLMDISTKELANNVADLLEVTDISSSVSMRNKRRIVAADEDDNEAFSDFDDFADEDAEDGDLDDSIDNMADTLDDMQDSLDDIQEDDPNIEIENNITNHLIAECESCGGVFISAIEMSDHMMESVHGVCPLCEKETDQYLKWVIRDVKSEDDDIA